MTNPFIIRRAGLDDVEAIGELFDQYRRFYEQPADVRGATEFIRSRLQRKESIILVGFSGESAPHGFCQLYPTFCSVAMAPIFVLYDLFVRPAARGHGLGRALMIAAQDEGRTQRVARMDLQTARTNAPARALYESLGWRLDDTFDTYHFDLGSQGSTGNGSTST